VDFKSGDPIIQESYQVDPHMRRWHQHMAKRTKEGINKEKTKGKERGK
jgi:hypothetical protein